MTYPPQGPSHPGNRPDPSQYPQQGGPSPWARPTGAEPTGAEPTEALPQQPGQHPQPAQAPPTERLARPGPAPDPATEHLQARGPAPVPPPRAMPQPVGDQPTRQPAQPGRLRGFLRDPLSIALVLIIVLALGLAGLIGGELYARKRANDIVAGVVQCVVRDSATASFGVMPPFLWQHLTRNYSSIAIQTAGNNVRDASEMSLRIDIKDVRLADTADSKGTIGSLVATVDWTTEGIKSTLQGVLPLVGGILRSVTTNPGDGTITVDAGLGTIVAKPEVVNGGLSLQVLSVSGLGFTLPRETVQPVLDNATERLTRDYPMGIHADSVTVTDTGVQSQFSTANAAIPKSEDDPCFAGI